MCLITIYANILIIFLKLKPNDLYCCLTKLANMYIAEGLKCILIHSTVVEPSKCIKIVLLKIVSNKKSGFHRKKNGHNYHSYKGINHLPRELSSYEISYERWFENLI